MRGSVWFLLVGWMALGGTGGGVWGHEGHEPLPSTGVRVQGNLVRLSPAAEQVLGLRTAKVTLEDLERRLRVNARVELPWDSQALVTTLAAGRIARVLVEPGEAVRAGQELVRVESLELQTLQLEMLELAEQLKLARQMVQQRTTLLEQGTVARKTLLESQTELRHKAIHLEIALRKLNALGLSDTTLQRVRATGEPVGWISLTSPIAGVVMRLDVHPGQYVQPTEHLLHIADRRRVLLVGQVLETDAWQLDPGQRVEATFEDWPDERFTGHVDRVRLPMDRTRRTLDLVVAIDNRQQKLRPGMAGRMAIGVRTAEEAVACPAEALIAGEGAEDRWLPDHESAGSGQTGSGRFFVLLRQGQGNYERREVQTGLWAGQRVDILEGLFPGDQVVVTGGQLLHSLFSGEPTVSVSRREPRASSVLSDASLAAEPRRDGTMAQGIVVLPTNGKCFATAGIEGRIARIRVQPGQAVQAGQVLAELDSQQLRSLQLELLQTAEKLRWQQETVERLEPAAGMGGVPQTRLWQQQMERKALEHRLHSVAGTLARMGFSSEDIARLRQTGGAEPTGHRPGLQTAPIRALAAGVVADFELVPGQIVAAGQVLFQIQDLDTVWVEAYLSEQHGRRVQIGQRVQVTLPAYPQLQLAGTLVRTAAAVHARQVLPVWIEVPNPGRKLREGMFAQVLCCSAQCFK